MEEMWKGDAVLSIGSLECNYCGSEEDAERIKQNPFCSRCHAAEWNIVVNKVEEEKRFAV